MMNYSALHCHSEYSVRDSLIRADELPKLAAKNGWTACAITDHGGVEGVPAFLRAAQKAGVKAIAGIEFYVACPDTYHIGARKKGDKLHHLTVLAKNAKGFSSILEILSIAHRDSYDTKQRVAAVPLGIILEKLEECIVLSGCFSGPFWRGTSDAAADLVQFMDRFKEDFYLEVQPHHDWNPQIELNRTILSLSQDLGIPLVVTPDCHYSHADEETFHDALIAVSARMAKDDPKRTWRFSSKQCFMKRPEEVVRDLTMAGLPEDMSRMALLESAKIGEKIDAWTWDDLPKPDFPTIEGDLRTLVWNGFEERGFRGRLDYEERLKKELDTFTAAGLDRYLLLVRHCINLFRAEGAEIGPRGSVGGSLVAHCLGITPLDPVAHGLPWERFYAPGRKGWPDVDVDLDEETRERAPDILRKAFGEDRVAQISNYTTYKLRMAINDAARAYGVFLEDTSKFEDDRAFLRGKKEDEIDIEDIPPGKELARKSADAAAFARLLVGRVRQFGAHAGGFVISSSSLMGGRAAIVSRGKDKALPWDMEVAEELGFVKLDFLGVDALSAIKTIGRAIEVNWAEVPLDDPEVFKDFSEGRTAGVPQFLTPGLKSFVRNLKPTKFEDLVWATSAFRPGALGQRSPEELVRIYRRDPNEILVYQEDVMRICVDIAGFSWTEATKVQKTMAKSQGIEAMGEWTDKFIEGCVKTIDADPEAARKYWESLLNFGRYAFNKCLDPETLVKTRNGNKKVGELEVGDDIVEADADGREWIGAVRRIWPLERRDRLELFFDDGSRVICTPEHRFLTAAGVRAVSELLRGGVPHEEGTATSSDGIPGFACRMDTHRLGDNSAGDIVYRRLVSFRRLAPGPVVDIEVSGPDHLFVLANGLISHNSHATSYSWNSYRLAWAKRHHPLEAFRALLRSEENSDPIIDEAPKFGVKILPPDPNRSGLDWEIEDGAIRMPLTKVEGVDLRLAKLIVAKRGNVPYKDEADMKSRLSGYKFQDSAISNIFSGKLPTYNFAFPVENPHGVYTKKELASLVEREKLCIKCELAKYCKQPVPIDFGQSNIMIVGESPGREEVKRRRPFVGPSGMMIENELEKRGISGKSFTWTNTSHCQPPYVPEGHKGPLTRSEIEELMLACPWLADEISMLKPPLILAVGKSAWQRLGGTGSITKANGSVIENNGTKIVACLHPAFVMRDRNRMPDFEMAISKFCDLALSILPSPPEPLGRRVSQEVSVNRRAYQFFMKR